jgi:predicted ATP-dependent Lon-type protease
VESQVRELLEFGPELRKNVEEKAQKVFGYEFFGMKNLL